MYEALVPVPYLTYCMLCACSSVYALMLGREPVSCQKPRRDETLAWQMADGSAFDVGQGSFGPHDRRSRGLLEETARGQVTDT